MGVEGNGSVRRPGQGSGRELLRVVLLLAVLSAATAEAPKHQAEGDSANTLPVNVTIHVGKRVQFLCGAPKGNPLDFHKFEGRCVVPPGSRAAWAVNSTDMSHNGYKFKCRLSDDRHSVAILTVYDDASSFGIIIGCTVGGFFTTLLFFAVAFRVIKKSERLQQCFTVQPPWPLEPSVSVSVLKMGHFTLLMVSAVFFALFVETEANYERLRIAGLVFSGLLFIAGISVIMLFFALFVETEANYERLRIAGLVFSGLLFIAGISVIIKPEEDSSEI
ncbi:hypothetical protein CRUP_037368 [Coryphaenoides rupestris]|nr:hypothetical protein CRUP_037368 [Coryphaenoides rupestris]